MAKTLTVDQLASHLGATVRGDGSRAVSGCATLDDAGPQHVSFLSNRKYIRKLSTSSAGVIVISPKDVELAGDQQTLLIADDPYYAFRQAMVELVGQRQHPAPGISEAASIASSAALGEDCHVGPGAVIADHAKLGSRCVIYPGCYVGRDVTLGDDCVLYPNVSIYEQCVLGNRVHIHSGTVVGHDGFGYATHACDGQPPAHHKIPQIGNVVIEDDVEIGGNCTIDRAAMGSTHIGQGTKISNLVSIGHGCKLGKHNLIVGLVGMAGSTETGDYVVIGGQAGVAGHLKIGDGAQIAAHSGIASDLPGGEQYGGAPAAPWPIAKRQMLAASRLPDMVATVRKMEKRIAELEAKLGGEA